MQVKTPYMPPPIKTTEQVKKTKEGTSMLQDFDPPLKAQLAHSISASVTSLFMSMLGDGVAGLKRRFDSKEYMLALAEKARLLTAKMQQ